MKNNSLQPKLKIIHSYNKEVGKLSLKCVTPLIIIIN